MAGTKTVRCKHKECPEDFHPEGTRFCPYTGKRIHVALFRSLLLALLMLVLIVLDLYAVSPLLLSSHGPFSATSIKIRSHPGNADGIATDGLAGNHDKGNGGEAKVSKGNAATEKASKSNQTEEHAASDAKREAARVLALGALQFGANLSVAVGRIPKMEKHLKSVRELEETSPRFQQQAEQAKSVLDSEIDNRDKQLMTCMDKIMLLNRYPPEVVSYAVKTIDDSDFIPREKMVWELLKGYLKVMSGGHEVGPKQWLSDFSDRFNNFVE